MARTGVAGFPLGRISAAVVVTALLSGKFSVSSIAGVELLRSV